ncbi:MAG: thioredoxin family protein [Spirochaetota bacterium]
MSDQATIRLLATLILGSLGFGVWRILGQSILNRARNKATENGNLPAGFIPGLPGLLVFSSPECLTCVDAQKPAVHNLADRLGKAIQILDVDVTAQPELADRYGVLSLPTIVVLDRTGLPQKVNHGFVPSSELHRQLAPYLIA